MATRHEVAQALKLLNTINKKLSTQANESYYQLLKDLDPEWLGKAVVHMISTRKIYGKYPTPHDIRSAYTELILARDQVPLPAEAWSEVRDAPADGIHRKILENNHIATWDHAFTHRLVDYTARLLGWPSNFWTDNVVSDRARFIQAYTEQLDRHKTIEQTVEELRPLLSQGPRRGPDTVKAIAEGLINSKKGV